MSDATPDVTFDLNGNQAGGESNDDMDSFFKQAQAEEASFNEDSSTTDQEIDNNEELQQRKRTEESTESRERTRDDAELSDEDGREEHSDKQVSSDEPSSDERHQQSYKVALKEERALRQQMQKDLQEQREASKKMADAFSKLVESADPAIKEAPIPSYDDDPIGHMKAKLEASERRIENLSKTEAEIKQDRQQQIERQRFMDSYRSQADSFEREQPDFKAAYSHLVNDIYQDYLVQGLSEADARAAVSNDELRLASQQMSNGNNPAKVIYDMAKRRGYAPASAPKKETKTNAVDTMNRIERGVKASRSINGKGVSPNNRMTLEEIAELNDDDFDAMDWNKVLQLG